MEILVDPALEAEESEQKRLEELAKEDPVAWKVSPLLRRCAETDAPLAEAKPAS